VIRIGGSHVVEYASVGACGCRSEMRHIPNVVMPRSNMLAIFVLRIYVTPEDFPACAQAMVGGRSHAYGPAFHAVS